MTVLAAAGALAQPAPRWVSVGNDPDSELFYDAARVTRRGAIVEYRLRAVMRDDSRGEMRSLTAQGRLDCAEQTVVYSGFQPFDAAGRPMELPAARTQAPQPVWPGGPQARLYERLCPGRLLRPLPAPPIMVVPSPRPPAPTPPITPPAPPPPRAPDRSARAQWQVQPHSLITTRDYPSAALRADEQGRTQVRLAVARSGRVTGCTVTISSGSAALDAATCRLLQERARFTPARDARGRRTTDTIPAAITWQIPD